MDGDTGVLGGFILCLHLFYFSFPSTQVLLAMASPQLAGMEENRV